MIQHRHRISHCPFVPPVFRTIFFLVWSIIFFGGQFTGELFGAAPDVFDNVPEVVDEGYQLVYTLPIENQASYNITGTVPYSVDNSASLSAPFDRIAYYLELDDGNGLVYAYVSMDAFTSNIGHIGLPIANNGVSFQRLVSNMNVVTNSANVVTGSGIATGNIEFWPTNYSTANSAAIPNASDTDFDFGDVISSSGIYASFQVHNHGASQTIFAYNQWGGFNPSLNGDLGIGNSPDSARSDWTFAGNADSYTIKNLQILVRPTGLSINSNLERAIYQRNAQNQATVPINGLVISGITSVEARAIPRPGTGGNPTGWQIIDSSPSGGSYSGSLAMEIGWYDIEVRSLDGADVIDQRMVERVGVGEVFVIAGQSNSANYGSDSLAPTDDRVSTFDLNSWRLAVDPQPIATGAGGSPWPALGDSLATDQAVPVGFISVGWGGTSVAEWLPGASGPAATPLYDRLQAALQALGPGGARAVLWHQGETDNALNTSTVDYRQRLETIIAQSRIDAGFDIPWGIAQATFIPPANVDQNVINAQQQVAENDPLNFVGAFTDDLVGPAWRAPDGIHFNETGLREHAARWLIAIEEFFFATPQTVVADSIDISLGVLSGGGVAELELSDNQDLSIRRHPQGIQSVVEFDVKGDSHTETPATFEFVFEASVFARSAVEQTISLFNYQTSQFEQLDTRPAAQMIDMTVSVTPIGDLARFVEPGTGCIECRIRFQSLNPRQQFTANSDQAIWLITGG